MAQTVVGLGERKWKTAVVGFRQRTTVVDLTCVVCFRRRMTMLGKPINVVGRICFRPRTTAISFKKNDRGWIQT